MKCPKCGFSQDDERTECASCGIVFARWHALQMPRMPQNASVPVEQGVPISRWILLVVVMGIVILGGFWTRWRREARAKHDPRREAMTLLNDINNKRVREQQRYEAEQDRKEGTGPLTMKAEEAKQLIEQCAAFTERATIRLPQAWDDSPQQNDAYPALARALELGIVEKMNRSGAMTTLLPGPGVAGIEMIRQGDEYEIDLGYRRIHDISTLLGTATRAEARFLWAWQGHVAARTLLNGGGTHAGSAQFVNENGTWRVTDATLWQDDGSSVQTCRRVAAAP